MYATIKLLIENTSLSECTNCSEDAGMNNVATWVRKLYNTEFEAATSLSAGNIIIISLEIFKNLRKELSPFFSYCSKSEVPAIIFSSQMTLNSDLTERMGRLGKEKEIAVFCISSAIEYQIEKELISTILMCDDILYSKKSLLSDFLFKKRNMMGIAVERAESLGIRVLLPYCVLLIKVEMNTDNDMSYNHYYRQIQEQIDKTNSNIIMTFWDRVLVVVFTPSHDQEDPTSLIQRYCQQLMVKHSDIIVKCTLGRPYKPLTMVRKSFDEALFTLNLYNIIKSDTFIKNYNDVGFFKILRGSHNVDVFREYYNGLINKIRMHDESNNSELVRTLRALVDNDFNLDKTANVIYAHKNTLRYRISRITEITGHDLKNRNVQLNYYICFMIERYLGHIDEQGVSK